MITISGTAQQDNSKTIELNNIPNLKAYDWVDVKIVTDSPNLRYNSYCDVDNQIKIVLHYVPTQNGYGQVTLTDVPVSIKY